MFSPWQNLNLSLIRYRGQCAFWTIRKYYYIFIIIILYPIHSITEPTSGTWSLSTAKFLSKTFELNSSITCKLTHNSLGFVVLLCCQTPDLDWYVRQRKTLESIISPVKGLWLLSWFCISSGVICCWCIEWHLTAGHSKTHI